MRTKACVPPTVDEYIHGFPKAVQTRLRKLRAVIKKAAPDAEEKISYRMPAYAQNGYLVFFAAYKNHIGLYPLTKAIKVFKKEISPYVTAKGSVQFPLDEPLPYDLVERIVRFRVAENAGRKSARFAPRREVQARARTGQTAARRRSQG